MRPTSTLLSVAIGAALLSLPVANVLAETPPVSVGAGIQTSFKHSEIDVANSADVDDFNLDSARIYISGKVTDTISLMFNTEYNGGNETVGVIDAVAQFAISDKFNIWAGRFLPPSDRANLYGPYYSNHWGVYTDGIQDGYPFETTGRDDGVMYWGQFGMAKVSVGAFDVQGLTKGSSDVLAAARVQLDFWDPEGGYYLNGTYYGEKDLLAVGVAAQNSDGNNAYTVDFLLEKKLGGAGVVSVEAEYAKYDGLGGYPSPRTGVYDSSDGMYVLAAYLLPGQMGVGKLQFLAKYAQASFDYATNVDVDQDTIELNVNYIIKSFNARVGAFYIDTKYDPSGTGTAGVINSIRPDGTVYGIALQIQL
jgi:hypothetical protein